MIPSHRLKKLKRNLRREVLARRDAMPPEARAAASLAIAERLLALPELQAARAVMLFSSFGSEVDTTPMLERLEDRGVRGALPRIEDRDIVPVAYRVGDPVTATPFGAREPAAGQMLADAEVDVVVTPGVAFDRQGRRIGYGGGFYDRFFGRARPGVFRVAVAFALQVVEDVPQGHADLPVQAIVTEFEVIWCRVAAHRGGGTAPPS